MVLVSIPVITGSINIGNLTCIADTTDWLAGQGPVNYLTFLTLKVLYSQFNVEAPVFPGKENIKLNYRWNNKTRIWLASIHRNLESLLVNSTELEQVAI